MARIRTVKPEFFTSLTLADLPIDTRLLFIGLWTYVDDDGRGVDDARLVKAAVFPLDEAMTPSVIEGMLGDLASAGRLRRYCAQGRRYFAVVNWREHQRIDKPTESKLPPPESGEPLADTSGNPPGGFAEASGLKGKEGKGTGEPALERRQDVDDLCDLLAKLIEGNGCRPPTITKRWRTEARLLIDKDGVSQADAEQVMRWALHDSFWKSNVLSMPTFREKYDRLKLRAFNGATVPRAPVEDAPWS